MVSLCCSLSTLRFTRVQPLLCISRCLKLVESGDIKFADPPPFDYMGQFFTLPRSFMDPTPPKFNENSKIIVVEGNIGSGKSYLASKLAEHFGLVYIPDPTEDDIYIFRKMNPPFDLRSHNALLRPSAKYYTCEMFWNQPDLITKGKPLYLQFQFYVRRFWNYLRGMCTLFNTGRGFVTDRSPFSEIAFSDAFVKAGHLSDRAHRWFNQAHGLTSRTLWKPHLIIYVKATTNQIRERIRKRNLPWEMNSCNLTDEFLDTLTGTLEKSYLARMSRYSEVMTIDGSTIDVYDDDDIRIIAENCTEIDLEGTQLLRDDYKFLEWRLGLFYDRTKVNNRARFSSALVSFKRPFGSIEIPFDLNEFRYDHDDRQMQVTVLNMDPRTKYPPSLNTRYTSLFDIMFNPFVQSRNYERDLPKDFLWV